MVYRVGVLSTFFDECNDPTSFVTVEALYQATKSGQVPAQLGFIATNKATTRNPVARAYKELMTRRGVPFFEIDHRKHHRPDVPWENDIEGHKEFEQELARVLDPYQTDTDFAIGFKQPLFEIFNKRNILNIHPSAQPGDPQYNEGPLWEVLPAQILHHDGPFWKWRAYGGMMAQTIVNGKIEGGQAIAYARFPLRTALQRLNGNGRLNGDSEEIRKDMNRKRMAHPAYFAARVEIARREPYFVIEVASLLARDWFKWDGKRMVVGKNRDPKPTDFTPLIDGKRRDQNLELKELFELYYGLCESGTDCSRALAALSQL